METTTLAVPVVRKIAARSLRGLAVPLVVAPSLLGHSVPAVVVPSLSGRSVPAVVVPSLPGRSVPAVVVPSLPGRSVPAAMVLNHRGRVPRAATVRARLGHTADLVKVVDPPHIEADLPHDMQLNGVPRDAMGTQSAATVEVTNTPVAALEATVVSMHIPVVTMVQVAIKLKAAVIAGAPKVLIAAALISDAPMPGIAGTTSKMTDPDGVVKKVDGIVVERKAGAIATSDRATLQRRPDDSGRQAA